jgi:MFS family permease
MVNGEPSGKGLGWMDVVATLPWSRRLSRRVAFWMLAALLGFLLFAASAPSPLYRVYQERWHFSASTLTSVFAVYALALLVALIFAGSLSDHVGRRPALLAALALEIAGMVLFGAAVSVGWLFAARTLQGLGTGVATGTISASLIDLQPGDKPALGAQVSGTAPAVGLALGALGSGLLVQYAPSPMRLVYWLLVAIFAAGLLAVLLMPEPVRRDAGWLKSLRPHLGVPLQARSAFAAVAPVIVATWALGALYLSLGPSLAAVLLHARSHVTGGLVVVALAGTGALASVLARGWRPDRAMIAGSLALIAGVAVTLPALRAGSTGLFLAGSVIAGVGFGPAFLGVFKSLVPLAPADQRAALAASIYVVSYLAFSLPAIAAGAAVGRFGLERTTTVYGIVVAVLAAAATLLFWLQGHHRRAAAVTAVQHHLPACPGTVATRTRS